MVSEAMRRKGFIIRERKAMAGSSGEGTFILSEVTRGREVYNLWRKSAMCSSLNSAILAAHLEQVA